MNICNNDTFERAKLGERSAFGLVVMAAARDLVGPLRLPAHDKDEARANIHLELVKKAGRLSAFHDFHHYVSHYKKSLPMLCKLAFPTKGAKPIWKTLPKRCVSLGHEESNLFDPHFTPQDDLECKEELHNRQRATAV